MTARKRKLEQRDAAIRETQRRHAVRLAACPLSPDELHQLLDFLAERIDAEGHRGGCDLTARWCSDQSHDAPAVLAFLANERLRTDFDIAVGADPFQLFGSADTRGTRMPLSGQQLAQLIDHVEVEVHRVGCAHDTRIARAWLVEHNLPVATTLFALGAQGGWCDCEIVMNVPPAAI